MTKEKFLIFDTETTGLLPASQHRVHKYNTHQYPYIVQFSWMIYDNKLKRVTKIEDHIVRLPEGMIVPLESSKVHGITTKIMRKLGENILDVLKIFTKDLLDSDYIVAHNINYDKTIQYMKYRCFDNQCVKNIVFYRLDSILKRPWLFQNITNISKNVCQISALDEGNFLLFQG